MNKESREVAGRSVVFRDNVGNEIGRYIPSQEPEYLCELGQRVCDAYMNNQIEPGTFLKQSSFLRSQGLEFDRNQRDLKALALKDLLRNPDKFLHASDPGTDRFLKEISD